MKSLKSYVRRIVSAAPGGQAVWSGLSRALGRQANFSGWGMVANTHPPWHNEGNDLAKDFLMVHLKITRMLQTGEFKLHQFQETETKDQESLLNELMWRHYVVFWSARRASKTTHGVVRNLVECGVCDGLTVFFAMEAIKGNAAFKSFLYDAWEGMKKENLLDSEIKSAGDYDYLRIENTKRNLAAFHDRSVFNKGYIPDSFEGANNPTEVTWLHIDLNSSVITKCSLDFFYDRVVSGGLILFDDYAWPDYYDTKVVVDQFFSGKSGTLLHLPTGQAIYFKD